MKNIKEKNLLNRKKNKIKKFLSVHLHQKLNNINNHNLKILVKLNRIHSFMKIILKNH